MPDILEHVESTVQPHISDDLPPAYSNRITLRVHEVAEMLGVSKGAIYKEINAGAIQAVIIGERTKVIPRREVSRLINDGMAPSEATA